MNTLLTDLQADLVERLKADSYFTDIPVFDEVKGDIVSNVEIALGTTTLTGTKLGVCAVVRQIEGTDKMPDAAFGPIDLDIEISVVEHVPLNNGSDGTLKSGLNIARRIHKNLKHYRPAGLANCFVPASPTIRADRTENENIRIWTVRFIALESDADVNSKVLMPTISPTTGSAPKTVTLSCSTSGAAIYYTTDGTHPWSGNSTATLYTTPFTVSTAKTVRACAYKTSSIPSDVNSVTYT